MARRHRWAERHDCSTKSIWRRLWRGRLLAQTERVDGSDGRPVITTLIRVSDLDQTFGLTAHDEHVQKIREAASLLTRERLAIIARVFTCHRRDRDTVEAARQRTTLIHVN